MRISTVSVISKLVPNYRVRFFNLLGRSLWEHRIRLHVYHGAEPAGTAASSVGCGVLDSEIERWVDVRHIGNSLMWHKLPKNIWSSDLIVMSQSGSILSNYVVMAKQKAGAGFATAFWGHGRNFQSTRRGRVADKIKDWMSLRVDWWFAYNNLSASIVQEIGYPKERITPVGNAVDIRGMIERKATVTEAELESMRMRLGLESENISVYTGGLYRNKRLPFLLKSALLIRERIPDFSLIIIGDGPDRHLVKSIASEYPWIHYMGAMDDETKTPYWMLSKLLLMPGAVGLVVVDSFALGVPIVTTDYPYHGPEIDYLKSGFNGEMIRCGDDVNAYAEVVCRLLMNPEDFKRLREGALRSAPEHTVEKMVENFTSGVLAALDAPRL